MAERLRVCLCGAAAACRCRTRTHSFAGAREARRFFGRCVFQRLEKGWLGPHFLSQTLEKGWLAKTAVFQHKVFDCTCVRYTHF